MPTPVCAGEGAWTLVSSVDDPNDRRTRHDLYPAAVYAGRGGTVISHLLVCLLAVGLLVPTAATEPYKVFFADSFARADGVVGSCYVTSDLDTPALTIQAGKVCSDTESVAMYKGSLNVSREIIRMTHTFVVNSADGQEVYHVISASPEFSPDTWLVGCDGGSTNACTPTIAKVTTSNTSTPGDAVGSWVNLTVGQVYLMQTDLSPSVESTFIRNTIRNAGQGGRVISDISTHVPFSANWLSTQSLGLMVGRAADGAVCADDFTVECMGCSSCRIVECGSSTPSPHRGSSLSSGDKLGISIGAVVVVVGLTIGVVVTRRKQQRSTEHRHYTNLNADTGMTLSDTLQHSEFEEL